MKVTKYTVNMAMEKSSATPRTLFKMLVIELIDYILDGFNYAVRQMHCLRQSVGIFQPLYGAFANSSTHLTGILPECRNRDENALNTRQVIHSIYGVFNVILGIFSDSTPGTGWTSCWR